MLFNVSNFLIHKYATTLFGCLERMNLLSMLKNDTVFLLESECLLLEPS